MQLEERIEGRPKTSGSSDIEPTETPVIKKNLYPYINITCSQAQTLASNMESGKYTSSLMFGAKASNLSILLSTGASDTFCKQGIYDLVGNVLEWTLEKNSNSSSPCVIRSGNYSNSGSITAANRSNNGINYYDSGIGFRVSIF